MKSVIDQIQDEDPSFDPLAAALLEAGVSQDLWRAATDRIYFDGYYGPIRGSDWSEQDGREPATVSEATKIVARVLEEVHDYQVEDSDGFVVAAEDIRAALVAPWWQTIYGTRYPQS